MDLVPLKDSRSSFYVTVKDSLKRAGPGAVRFGLFVLFVTYTAAWFYSPLSSYLARNLDIAIAAAFGLGWLAFTTLLQAEREAIKPPPGSRIISSDGLGIELRKLADERQVELDIFSYSTETFLVPLQALFTQLAVSDHPAESVAIRILLRDWSCDLLLPGCVRDSSIDRGSIEDYRNDSVQHQKHMRRQLMSCLAETQKTLRRTQLSFAFKAYPFDPFHKGVLVNGTRGFWSLYRIRAGLRSGYDDVLDYEGQRVNFSEFRNDGTPSEIQALRSVREWFDAVWTTCSIEVQ